MVFVREPKPVETQCSTALLGSWSFNFSIIYSRQFSAGYTDKFGLIFPGCLPTNLDVDVVSSLGHKDVALSLGDLTVLVQSNHTRSPSNTRMICSALLYFFNLTESISRYSYISHHPSEYLSDRIITITDPDLGILSMLVEHPKSHVLYELPWHCCAMEDVTHCTVSIAGRFDCPHQTNQLTNRMYCLERQSRFF